MREHRKPHVWFNIYNSIKLNYLQFQDTLEIAKLVNGTIDCSLYQILLTTITLYRLNHINYAVQRIN
jgi:hypothetical protein